MNLVGRSGYELAAHMYSIVLHCLDLGSSQAEMGGDRLACTHHLRDSGLALLATARGPTSRPTHYDA